jgi:putative DNA primase/helicase
MGNVLDLRTMARALGGEVVGRQVLAPGPGHSPRDRSLSVTLSPSSPDGIIVFSHAGDPWQACKDHVKTLLGVSHAKRPSRVCRQPVGKSAHLAPVSSDRSTRALALWNGARAP